MSNPLTASDEHGLRGLSLDGQLRRAFFDLPTSAIWQLAERMPGAARKNGLVYFRDGVEDVINVFLRPTGIFPEQLNYFHTVSLTLQEVLKRVPDWYLENEEVRKIVPLDPDHEAWLRETWTPGHSNGNCVFGRLDAMADFTSPAWKDTFMFVEPNLVGVGGISLIPGAERSVMNLVYPALKRFTPELNLEANEDCEDLFLREMQDQLELIGRSGGTIAFCDAKYSGDGPAEFQTLADYCVSHGQNAIYCDPTELEMRNVNGQPEAFYQGAQVDVVYRDYDTRDYIALRDEGGDPDLAKLMFKRNQMVSSMAGDFDHKSTFELLTDPRFSRFFTTGERQLLRRHLLWTRLLNPRKTADFTGEEVDLFEFARAHRDQLVIKPNRSYGGDRVYIGSATSESDWDAALHTAAQEPDEWVAQKLAIVTAYEFPVVETDRSVSTQPFYVVFGFAPTKYGTAILGRASQKQVVNVAQKGGICVVLVGKH